MESVGGGEAKRRLLEQLRAGRSARPAHPELVALQPRGPKRPFFCVHPATGGVSCYADAARRFEQRPFYGLQPPGFDGECAPIEGVDGYVERYLAAIRSVQPEGPYLLGGWSAGGLISYQMARVLEREGQKVALLVMIDTWRPGTLASATPEVRDHVNALAVQHISVNRGRPVPYQVALDEVRAVEGRDLNMVHRLDIVFDILHRHGALPSTGAPMFDVYRAVMRSLAAYKMSPEPYHQPILLLRSARETPVSDPLLNWGSHAIDIEVIHVEATHYGVFSGETGVLVADTLRARLDATEL